ncbi:hypothetical protein E2605_11695 [Dysgonomonas capnocytophagoides]|uniref:Uncharacterized protein n=1 Tax=Dysgonomonas capnocytophagoides TaxID=45254 RepID=A0A4Y8KYG2_9BACT|nr:hypothetical protein [Dysgonomonas capnocytophagoides]TFD95503.1 hypothetical protein E2605_11695 [Dysgonomonas capnocytophagoides]
MSDQIGRGYVKAACEAVGVSKNVYYKALKNKAKKKPLSKNQVDVLSEYKSLLEEGQRKLQNL